MPPANAADRCPYCHVTQIGTPGNGRLYRCHGCNYFVHEDWLIDDPLDYVLNDDRPWCCPWCAYPVAMEYDLPGDETFMCPGCAGTLTADDLVTQSALEVERKRSMKGRTYLLILGAMVLVVIFLFSWVIKP